MPRAASPQPECSECSECQGLLGPLDPGTTAHPFCAWAQPDDWKALRPYLDGTLRGVHASFD